MKLDRKGIVFGAVCLALTVLVGAAGADGFREHWQRSWHHRLHQHRAHAYKKDIELGPRPYYLVDRMSNGRLKDKLQQCSEVEAKTSDFSISHRGAALQFPEHTEEGYSAAARMGAGIIECDVAFTKDRELVCRHDQCDLHQTTNILATPLASHCSVLPDYSSKTPFANVKCCTHDVTLDQFKSLCGKMDGIDRGAATAEQAMRGTADWRSDLYSTCGTLMTHKESIQLFDSMNLKMTPELKTPPKDLMPFEGDFTQEQYADKMIREYEEAGIQPYRVFPQSFLLDDILYWVSAKPAFGKQAVFLDGRYDDPAFDYNKPKTWQPSMQELKAEGVNIIAPPMWMLLKTDKQNRIQPSRYAKRAKKAGLDIITWTFERSDLRLGAQPNPSAAPQWYYQSIPNAIKKDADMYLALDALAQKVGILGIFSDWPATVTYYANCMGL